jgi:hypothetical protein
MRCVFCARSSQDPAADEWVPFYGDKELDKDVDGPVCPECAQQFLYLDPDEKYFFKKPATDN